MCSGSPNNGREGELIESGLSLDGKNLAGGVLNNSLGGLSMSFSRILLPISKIQTKAGASIVEALQKSSYESFAAACTSASLPMQAVEAGLKHVTAGINQNLINDLSNVASWYASSIPKAVIANISIPQFRFPGIESIYQQRTYLHNLARTLFGDPDRFRTIARNLRKSVFPVNIAEVLDHVSVKELEAFVLAEGIGVYGAPRSAIVAKLVKSDSRAARRKMLYTYYAQIISDCESALSSLSSQDLFPEIEFVMEAIETMQSGHPKAAQALLTVTLDSLISRLIGDKKTRKSITAHNSDSEPPLNTDANNFRMVLAWFPVWNAHGTFYASRGDEIPREFSRHATVHAVSKRQYSKRNCVQVLTLVTSLIKYAANTSEENWGVLHY